MAEEQRRVQLVVQHSGPSRTPFIGFGLLASLVIGFGQLNNAARGVGSFESAIGRYLLIAATCVLAGALLGRLLDNGQPEETLDLNDEVPMEALEGSEPTDADRMGEPANEEPS